MDWVINLLDTASEFSLVHRREGFRAHELTVGQVLEAADRGDVALHVPFQIREVSGNGHVERVRLFNSQDEAHEIEVEVDAILLQLGFKTALGPLKDWGFEVVKGAIVVDQLMKTSLERVWACGDIATFDGKLKLIATGFAESAIAVAQAVHEIRPSVQDPAGVLDQHRRTRGRCRPAVNAGRSPRSRPSRRSARPIRCCALSSTRSGPTGSRTSAPGSRATATRR